ncbi:MAG: DMT family transporter [Pseudomonadota bacterium]
MSISESSSAQKAPASKNPILVGIALITVGMLALSVMDALVKWLVGETYSPVQLLAVRSWISVPVFLLLMHRSAGIGALRTKRLPAQLARGLVGMATAGCFFYSLTALPLADAVAISFASTFLMTALSALWLKEHVGMHRWGSVIVGFIGVLVITRPGTDAFRVEAIFTLLSALGYALFILSGRLLSRTETTSSLVFYHNLTIMLACSLPLYWLWQPMPLTIIWAMLAFAALALLGHFAVTHAFKLAPVGAIAPFEYSALLWSILLGFVIWGDAPDLVTMIGMAIIACSGLYILHRESRLRKRVENQ